MIRTNRLILAPISMEHSEDLFELWSDFEVIKYANSERRLSSPFRVTDFHSELNREHHYERIRAQKKI